MGDFPGSTRTNSVSPKGLQVRAEAYSWEWVLHNVSAIMVRVKRDWRHEPRAISSGLPAKAGTPNLESSGAGRLTKAGVCGKISLMHDSAHSGSPISHGHKLTRLRHAAIILLAATLLGFFFAAQIYFSAAS